MLRERLMQAQQKLIPDLIDKMYKRFSILTTISKNPACWGPRSLSEHMDMAGRLCVLKQDV